MNKSRELSDLRSCLNKAAHDEPLFVLRAKDPSAPMTVRHWVTMNQGMQPQEKLHEARMWCEEAEKWHNQNIPQPVASPVGYADKPPYADKPRGNY